MEFNLSHMQPELIISHIWSTRSKARLAVMQQSLDALLKDLGNPKIVPNDRQIISKLIEGRARWFSMGCNGYAVSIAEKYLDFNFADLVFIVGLAYNVLADIQHRYTENLIKKYFRRKKAGYCTPTLLYPKVTRQTYGLLVYREQAEKMIMNITDMSHDKAKVLIRNLRIGDYDAHHYGDTFISLGVKNGLPREKVRRVWDLISRQSQMLIDYEFSLALCWLLYQLQYLETYFSVQIEDRTCRFEAQYEQKSILYNIEESNSLSLLKDISEHKYLWEMCKIRISQCLPTSQFALFENVTSSSFQSSELILNVPNFTILEQIESIIDNISSIFRDIYGEDMRLYYNVG